MTQEPQLPLTLLEQADAVAERWRRFEKQAWKGARPILREMARAEAATVALAAALRSLDGPDGGA